MQLIPPVQTTQNASQFWLYLPAYLSLFIALAAACRALSHFITDDNVTVYLWTILIFNFAISLGMQCGAPTVAKWSRRARNVFFVLLPLSVVLFKTGVFATMAAEEEINATVSLAVGWAALSCVLLIGMRFGSNAKGDQRVPVAAPLVPALSLFGLLNSLSVDTLVQICFVIFVAAALYLIAYERLLSRVLASRQMAAASSSSARQEYSGLRSDASIAKLSRSNIVSASTAYLVACGLWFGVFMSGAALFYYPVEAVVPRVMGMPLNAVRGASAALLDWRGSSSTIELRGGDYPLSEREIMKIAVDPQNLGSGIPSLWRGRIYETYSDSRWSENQKSQFTTIRLQRTGETPLAEVLRQTRDSKTVAAFQKSLAPISPDLVKFAPFEATIQPQRANNLTLYFPGELTAIEGLRQLQASSTGTYNASSSYRAPPYSFRANLKSENLSALKSVTGLSVAELKIWRNDAAMAVNLEVDPELKKQLAPIIAQIKKAALSTPRGRFDTPLSKANAIRDYLTRTCTYSLSAPLVPPDKDAVIFFLTDSKSGACDMFASAMTLLLRAVDVPARLATGYIEPEEITSSSAPFARQTEPFGPPNATRFIVRERDAHAWVEYYISGAGWLNYDPTAGTRTTSLPLNAQIAGIFHFSDWQLDFKTLWLPGLGLLLIAAGLGWSYLDFRARKNQIPPTAEEIERERIVEIYGRALALLSRRVPRLQHQTPLEYEAAVQRAKIADPAKQEFSALTYLLMAARYRKEPPAMGQPELQACLARLRQALKRA